MHFNISQSIVLFRELRRLYYEKRLTIEDRILIENLLKLNYKLKDISNIVEWILLLENKKIKNVL